jgi:hypothetical protein
MFVASPTPPTVGRNDAVAGAQQLEQFAVTLAVVDHGSEWHANHGIASGSTVSVLTLTVLSMFSPNRPLVAEIVKGAETWVADQDDIAPSSPIASGGSPKGDEFLAAESDAAITAAARLYDDGAFIQKAHIGRGRYSALPRTRRSALCAPGDQDSDPWLGPAAVVSSPNASRWLAGQGPPDGLMSRCTGFVDGSQRVEQGL